MSVISDSARALLGSAAPAHVVTQRIDGTPQVSVVWVGLDGDEIMIGTQRGNAKVRNLRRNPQIVLSILGTELIYGFLLEHLLLTGRATIDEAGPASWLTLMDQLSQVYLGTPFPNRGGGENGVIIRVEVDRISGVGPWASG
jgi:PPOX class probable F420-dependent enzyme